MVEGVKRVMGGQGRNGGKRDRVGAHGKPATLTVPVGTVTWRAGGGGDEWELHGDLARDGEAVTVAWGGTGGKGNRWFATATQQEPVLAEVGDRGEAVDVFLEVWPLLDVALVGVPNAGKSSLLRAISNAKPKVADYPFTTMDLVPGVVERGNRAVTVVEVPGLLPGTHGGKGLGPEMVRRAQRARAVLQIVDGTALDFVQEWSRVASEVEACSALLGKRPWIVAVSKADIPEVRLRYREQRALLRTASGQDPLLLSAATGEGVEPMLATLLALVPEEALSVAPPEPEPEQGPPEPRPGEEEQEQLATIHVGRQDRAFVVSCAQAERVAQRVDLADWKTGMQFHQLLGRLGVIKALESEGVQQGDMVRIGLVELEWQ